MTKVLVAVASKHGSTAEIGREIAGTLEKQGLEVTDLKPEEVESPGGFDAFVLGSAVYAGHWMKEAKELVERLEPQLSRKPVWLFSSGPIGDPPKPDEDPVDVAEIIERTASRAHRVFAGKLVKKGLSFGEKAIVLAFRAPEGDYRDWDEIRSWAEEIARDLEANGGEQ